MDIKTFLKRIPTWHIRQEVLKKADGALDLHIWDIQDIIIRLLAKLK